MAIKDWIRMGGKIGIRNKKLYIDKSGATWMNRNISPKDLSTEYVFMERDTRGWKVWVHQYDIDLGLIRNTSKAKALKSAEGYMRSH